MFMSQSGAQILLQSLEKKTKLLDDMIRQNGVQEELLKEEDLDMDAFDEAINQQGFYIEELDRVLKLSMTGCGRNCSGTRRVTAWRSYA